MTKRSQTGRARQPEGPRDGEAAPRKPYHPPRLERYGRLTDLTRFGGSEILDSGGGLGDQL